MIKLYSTVEPHVGELLHICYGTYKDAFHGITKLGSNVIRQDLIPEEEFLQLAHITIKNKGHRFRPHKHLYRPVPNRIIIAQESWIVLNGSIKATFYDLDDAVIHTEILKEGDVSITLRGGHTYEVLENNTQVLEFKTGPYEGQSIDKKFIEEKEN